MAPLLLRYFLRRVDPPADAADLLNDCLLVAWRRIRTIPEDPDQERAWMYAVAANVLSNQRRSQRRRSNLTEALRSELGTVDPFGSSDLRVDISNALSQLAPVESELIRLIHWEGLSASEAGRVLGIPESSARMRYADAKRHLEETIVDVSN
jgi:RNA polymerase sigma-70 factor (ECF subfamily)